MRTVGRTRKLGEMEEERLFFCIYCGEIMPGVSDKAVEMLGNPQCCDENMIGVDKGRLYAVMKGLESVIEKLEKEIMDDISGE